MTSLILIIPIACLIVLALLFSRLLNFIDEKILSIEDRLKTTQDAELRRLYAKANDTIKQLEKENKQLKLILEMEDMEKELEKGDHEYENPCLRK